MYRVLEITTIAGCKIHCAYCPQDALARAHNAVTKQRVLDLETFARCLRTVPTDVDISFSGYSEPWLNPECTSMVEHARKNGHRIRIFSTLVGMTASDIDRIAALDVGLFVVHVFDDGTFMPKNYVDSQYINLVRHLIACDMPSVRFLLFGAVHPELSCIIPDDKTVRTRPLISRAGNVVPTIIKPVQPKSGKIVCQEGREYRNVLLPNGDVTLCCMDYGRQHVIGNLLQSHYTQIHHGEIFAQLLRRMKGEDGYLLCRTCEYAQAETDNQHQSGASP